VFRNVLECVLLEKCVSNWSFYIPNIMELALFRTEVRYVNFSCVGIYNKLVRASKASNTGRYPTTNLAQSKPIPQEVTSSIPTQNICVHELFILDLVVSI
jgi:hypothetical protein